MTGFIKLPRNLLDWGWRYDPNTLALYVILLLKAQWSDYCYKGVELKRGQLLTTVAELCRESGLSTRQTRTALDRLKSTGKITIRTTSKFSIITLLEYDCENDNNTINNKQITDKRQTKDKPSYI